MRRLLRTISALVAGVVATYLAHVAVWLVLGRRGDLDEWFVWSGLGNTLINPLMPLRIAPLVVGGMVGAYISRGSNWLSIAFLITCANLWNEFDLRSWPVVFLVGYDVSLSYSEVLLHGLAVFAAVWVGFFAQKVRSGSPAFAPASSVNG